MSGQYELNRFCLDGDCAGIAEPEEDLQGDKLLRYWVCRTCDMEFGHMLVENPAASSSSSCQLGIDDATLHRLNTVPSRSAAAPGQVFIGGIGRRPE